ncbi:type II secretion system protein [Campylobacter gastrosuis]|uniref:Type II secretion system GspH family protein n=1 Tax=Campylobacter gastrosuis TaxID=2974576 RepID=A0ABT7HRI8_9BACT|nr:type II secretion system protein [Campylobacter gastrosuis]MDL0089516.1 type II secretion system GspH family protein [Campylobacter gastrosuis]
MKKGFTMIELIFVIVILGILAAVAVPRLTATRDDAEMAKAATNLTTLISDITAYYTSQGQFAQDGNVADIKAMTAVQFDENGAKNKGIIKAAGKKCFEIELVKSSDATTGAGSTQTTVTTPSHIKLSKGSESTADICAKLYKNKGISDLFTSTITKSDGSKVTEANKGLIQVGGMGVVF